MRQAGYLAAAGLYALNHHVERLREDHRRAKALAEHLAGQPYVQEVLPVETNIVIFTLADRSPAQLIEQLEAANIKAIPFGKHDVRMVTHLDFDDDQLNRTITVLSQLR